MHHPSVPAALRIPGFAIPVLGNFAPVFEDERPEVSSDVRLGLGMMLRRLLDTCRRQATWKAKGGRGQNAGWVRMLRLTYCVMGLTKEVVIMVSVLAKPVWGCYGERVGNRLWPTIAFAFGVGGGLPPSAKRESQPLGLSFLHAQDPPGEKTWPIR